MKIVFLSNFYNHHQAFLSRKLFEITGGQFRFIETMKLPKQQIELGYRDIADEFLIFYNDRTREAQEWIDNADIVIVGSAQEKMLEHRKKCNKIILRCAERPLKKGFEVWKYPIRFFLWHKNNPKHKPIYMLCASAYTAPDYEKFGLYKGKMFKWGYFPECKQYIDFDKMMSTKREKEILWCGRFLDWKHPEAVLAIAERLKSEGYKFHISMIGTGEMQEELHSQLLKKSLCDYVSMLGTMSTENVRNYMEQAGIFLFTSDRKEGWGAVLNEAMNSGCAVVASDEIGAVPYLIKNNDNGLLYKSGDFEELYHKVKCLLLYSQEQKRLGRAAYNTIISEWNHDIAAKRLIMICEQILSDKQDVDLYRTGPCSKA